MLVKDTMTRHVEVINPDSTIKEAAEKMLSLNVGGLPVCDNNKIIGIITDRDITIRSTSKGFDPNNIMVKDIMTRDVECCYLDQNVMDVADQMSERHIKRLPVMSNNNTLIGIVTVGDFAKRASRKIAAKVLGRISSRENKYLKEELKI